MKLIILQEKLKEGLNVVERAVSKLTTLPVLNNILFRAEKNFLNLAATDLEIGTNWWALAKTEEDGQIILPGQIISSLIGFFPNKQIEISSQNLTVNIVCDNYQSTLKGLSPDDFPIIPSPKDGDFLRIQSDVFCRGLNQVVGISSPSSSRPEISGVYLFFSRSQIKIVATDSFRLGEKTIVLKNAEGLKQDRSLIIPQRAVREIINVFGEKKQEIIIYFSPNQILIECQMPETKHPQVQFVSRLIEGDFPNYQEIVPKNFETQIILSQKELLNQIKSASLFSGKANEIKLKINPTKNQAEIFSQSQDLGECQSQVPARIKGRAVEIAFNHKFLIDGLLNLTSSREEEVVLELTNEDGPAVLKPAGSSDYIYILMPIKKS